MKLSLTCVFLISSLFSYTLVYSMETEQDQQHGRFQALVENKDDYYANDLNLAVNAARQHTHHYDYSQPKRYNRTTSQSIPLKRIFNEDLDQTSITSTVLDHELTKDRTSEEHVVVDDITLKRKIIFDNDLAAHDRSQSGKLEQRVITPTQIDIIDRSSVTVTVR